MLGGSQPRDPRAQDEELVGRAGRRAIRTGGQ
jgi:hypothetical protein